MLRSTAASVRLVDVMNTASLSATMALACKAADDQSSSKNLHCSIWLAGRAPRPPSALAGFVDLRRPGQWLHDETMRLIPEAKQPENYSP